MSVVSSVLSRVSTRSTGWRINVRLSSLMDSIFAIGFGLGLRFVVDTVSHHDFKLTGTLVGLWEGVILLHFLKKMPKSSDPYIAFGVRLFIDFIFTESIARMVLVLIWTALGMVLADITPAIWEDVGLKRVWKSFRRDLYTITRMIPTVAFFPPTRTVRFSPSREPSVIIDEATEVLSPSIGTTEQIPITNDDPLSSTAPRVLLKRRVPGYFPVDYSDTETDSSVRAEGFAPQGRTSRRLSVYPPIPDYDDSSVSDLTTSPNDLDEANLSSDATETGEPPSALPDASEIPEIEDEPLLVDIAAAVPVKPEEGELTPTQQQRQPYMPPTPSDSAARWAVNREIQEPLPVRPPSELLPQIPDFLEEPASEDWEKIQPADYSEEKPPTPPAKDKPVGIKIPPPVPPVVQQQQPPPQSTTPPDDDMKGWDTMESQILTRNANANEDPNANTTTNENMQRQSQPPAYEDYETHDDIYGDPDDTTTNAVPTGNLIDNDDTGVPPAHQDAFAADNKPSLLPPLPAVDPSLNPWGLGDDSSQQAATSGVDEFVEQLKRDEEAAWLKAKQEAEEAKRQSEEEDAKKAQEQEQEMKRLDEEIKKEEAAKEEAKKKEEEAAAKKAEEERRAKEIEERKKKRAAEKAEREKKEKDDEIARQKKREEEEAAEKLKQEEEEKKKRLKEEAEEKKSEEAAQKKKDAEEAKARREEAAAKKAEEKRLKEEAKKAEEEEKRLKAEAKKAKEETKMAEEAKKEADRIEAAKLKAEEDAAKEAERVKEEEARVQREAEEVEAKKIQAQQQAEAEQANAQTTEDAPTQEQETAPAPEETTEDVTTPLAHPTEGGADPPEQPLSPAELNHSAPSEAADTASEASEAPPVKANDRVERMLSLRAQMVETEANLENLKKDGHDPNSPEVKQMEKILRKMHRQAERRYATGISYIQMLDDEKEPDTISLGMLNDNKSREKIAEKIEQLLDPTSRTLYLKINLGKKTIDQRKQKGVITRLTEDYNLEAYSFDTNKKAFVIDVAEEQFAEWLKGYRKLSTQEKKPVSKSLWG